MKKTRTMRNFVYKPVAAPRSRVLSCKSWQQEGALRMLQNNLDPEVAERPEDLVVYGGSGKAARNWDCFRKLEMLGLIGKWVLTGGMGGAQPLSLITQREFILSLGDFSPSLNQKDKTRS